ncbi:hypothetical protein HC024_00230 [Methylococcaceae bacterium WWC4]|nr:hypothetical protein [Methylococcaceae bacterium WWC4]
MNPYIQGAKDVLKATAKDLEKTVGTAINVFFYSIIAGFGLGVGLLMALLFLVLKNG